MVGPCSARYRVRTLLNVLKKWFGSDDAQSDPLRPDDYDSPDTHRVRILRSDSARPANDDDNPGYDPYDTGRFDTNS